MALTKAQLESLKTSDTGAYNQIISAGSQATGDKLQAMTDTYNKLFPTANTTTTPKTTPAPALQTATEQTVEAPRPAKQVTTTPVSTNEQPKIGATEALMQPTVQTATVETPKPVEQTGTQAVTPTPAPTTPMNITVRKKEQEKVTPSVQVEVPRANEILNNLNEGYRNDPAVQQALNSGDWAAFQSRYNMADPEEAKLVQAYFQARQPKDADGVYNILKTGQQIYNPAIKNSPDYKIAEKRLAEFNQFKGMNANQLASAINQGKLVAGSKVYNDLMNDPVASQAITGAVKINSINKKVPDVITVGETQTESILNSNPVAKGALDDGVITPDEYKQMLETPEITDKRKDVEGKKNEYDRLKAEYDNVGDEVEKQYQGKLSNSAIQALISQRRKGIYRDLEVASTVFNNALGTLKDMTDTQATIVDMNFDMYKTRQAQQFEKDMFDYQTNRDFDLKYGDIKSTDPRVRMAAAERAVADIREAYKGMPFVRSSNAMSRDIINMLDQNPGMTLSEAIDKNIITPIQNSPYFKEWAVNNKLFKDEYTQKMQNLELQTATEQLRQLKQGGKYTRIGDTNYYQDTQGNVISQSELDEKYGGTAGENWLASMGDGKITYTGGRVAGDEGVDIAGKEGFAVYTPVGGQVTKVFTGNDKYFGSYIEVTGDDGIKTRISHLDPNSINVKQGDTISSGEYFANQKNSGTVIAGKGRGVVDITMFKGGKKIKGTETAKILKGVKIGGTPTGTTSGGDLSNLAALGEYLIDSQPRGPGFSEEDVAQFTDKITKYVQRGDANMIYKAYRDNLMSDKDLRGAIDDSQKFVRGLDEISKLLGDYKKGGNKTGVKKAIAEKIARELGTTTDEALAGINTQIGVTMADYIRSISGTAASDTEVQRLAGLMANTKNIDTLNTAIIGQLKTNAYNTSKALIENRMYGLPEDLKTKVFGDIYKKEVTQKTGQQTGFKWIGNNKYEYTSPRGFTFTGTKGVNLDDAVIESEAQKLVDNYLKKNPGKTLTKDEVQKIILKDPFFKEINFKLNFLA